MSRSTHQRSYRDDDSPPRNMHYQGLGQQNGLRRLKSLRIPTLLFFSDPLLDYETTSGETRRVPMIAYTRVLNSIQFDTLTCIATTKCLARIITVIDTATVSCSPPPVHGMRRDVLQRITSLRAIEPTPARYGFARE